jgi:ABC-type methionine transport system ATPase subunit
VSGPAIVKKRVYLTYPTELIKEPVVCEMYDRLGVRFNLRTASVNEEIGIIGLELEGEEDRVQAAMAFFRQKGVRVEPIELDVVEG